MNEFFFLYSACTIFAAYKNSDKTTTMFMQFAQRLRHNKSASKLVDKVFHACPSLAAYLLKVKKSRDALREGLQLIDKGMDLPEGASREGFIEANRTQHMNLSEYLYQYNLYQKTKAEREEFLSYVDYHALVLKLRMKYPEHDHMELLKDKEKFLRFATSLGLCHRRWLYAPESTFEEFADLLSSSDCIMKPHDTSWGIGIYKVNKQEGLQVRELYDKCVKELTVVEECITGYHVTQAFHPASLNTVRVMTVSYNGRALLFGGMLRVGCGGTVVDNTHAGGLYAQIDINTGIIESDGIDTEGKHHLCHPDSKIQFKGFPIPFWDKITALCLNAAPKVKHFFIGWDIAILENGDLEVIEANSRPDFDGLQTPLHKGMKRTLYNQLKELMGDDFKE